jgi:hypothetical protein
MPKAPGHKLGHPKKKKAGPVPLNNIGRQALQRLRNIQVNQYGAPGDQALLTKYARRIQNGRPMDSQDYKVRAGLATRDKLALRAGKTVQAELNPQIGAAKNYEAGVKVLYDKLAGQEQATQNQQLQQQQQSAAGVSAGYDKTASDIASNFRGSREQTGSELNRLGLSGISDQNSGNLENLLTGLTRSGQSNAGAIEGVQNSAANQLMGMLSNQSADTGAELSAASSQNRGSLEASRAGKVYSLWNQFIDQRKAQNAATAQQHFLNRITRAKLGASTDLSNAQALQALGTARKSIVDSKRPTTVKKPRIR